MKTQKKSPLQTQGYPWSQPRFNRSKLALALLCAHVACAAPALAAMPMELTADSQQTAAPGLVGQLSNAQKVLLQGAMVRLTSATPGAKPRETVTDSSGRFRFDGLPAGDYRLEVSYLGYGKHQLPVSIQPLSGQWLQLKLQPQVGMEVMKVTGSREGQARALNIQRAADNIKSVVSADYLGRFPDANVAESVQRLPGISIQRDQGEGRYVNVRGAPLEFASVTVNGTSLPSPNGATRAIDLDTIPSDVISTLEVTKAITPNMDADAIAGNINIITQGALDSKEPIARANLAAGQNEKGSGAVYNGGLTLGQQLQDGKLGLLLSASHSKTERVTDNVEHTWSEQDNGQYLPELTEFKDYELTRSRSGVSGRLDFRPNDQTQLYLAHHFSRFSDDEYRDTMTIALEKFSADATASKGVAGRATFDKEVRHRKVVKTINSTQAGGSSRLQDWTVDYGAAHSTASEAYPHRDYLIFREKSRPALAYDFSDSDYPQYQVLDSKGKQVRADFNFPADQFNFRRYERRFGEAEETEQALHLDLSRLSQWGQLDSSWKLGLKARLKDKDNDEDRRRNAVGKGGPAYATVATGPASQPFDGRYQNGNKYQRDFVAVYASLYENADYKLLPEASQTTDFAASEDTLAAYAMNTLSWDSTTLLLGLRLEHTSTEGNAVRFDADTEQFSPQQAKDSYSKWFPSAHLRHELDNGVILRTAYSTGLNRPNFADLVPYLIVEERSEQGGSISIGNIGLTPTYSHNLDLMTEYYLEPLGQLSAGVFYKYLLDPMFKARSVQQGGEFAGFQLTRPENGDKGRLYGLELNWQQTLASLPGFGVMLNYTLTDSAADLPFGIGQTDLPGTSRHSYNAALNYEADGYSAQLAYNYRSEYIDALDTADPKLNTYWDERATLDFSAGYKFSPQFSLFVEATNLTDSQAIRYQGVRSRVFEHEQFGRAWQLGVRGSF